MHVHASDRKLTENGSAKFFVKDNGDAVVQKRGILNDREIAKIQSFIKDNYKEMYLKWSQYSNNGYFSQSDREQQIMNAKEIFKECQVKMLDILSRIMYIVQGECNGTNS